jgi:peptidoglycan/xylan/chitin deacetylase (PgdA/CDA1 family)
MSWEELRELRAAGVEVGAHTVNHVVLTNVPAARARSEIQGCRAELGDRLGEPPRHFAYPNGYYSPAIRRVVAECGFASAVTTDDLENRRGGDAYALRRKTLWENSTQGPRRYSGSVAACNLDGVFGVLRLKRAPTGERPDRVGEDAVEHAAAG